MRPEIWAGAGGEASMLTLRGWAMLLAIGALLQPAAAAQPDHATYVLGVIQPP